MLKVSTLIRRIIDNPGVQVQWIAESITKVRPRQNGIHEVSFLTHLLTARDLVGPPGVVGLILWVPRALYSEQANSPHHEDETSLELARLRELLQTTEQQLADTQAQLTAALEERDRAKWTERRDDLTWRAAHGLGAVDEG